MNIEPELKRRVELARAWLLSMTTNGGLCRNLHVTSGERGAVSSEITGYGAHLFAWLFAVEQRHEDRMTARAFGKWLATQWHDAGGYLPYETETDLTFFFDIGIAARGLYAVAKSTQSTEYWDMAITLASQMTRFRIGEGVYRAALLGGTGDWAPDPRPFKNWWSWVPGPHQRKAALAWKAVKRFGEYDDVDTAWVLWSPAEEPGKRATRQEHETAADLLHPLAYSCEALLISEASQYRAYRDIAILQSKINSGPDFLRCDVLAQYLRLHLLQGLPLPMGMLDRLLDMQHESGGFYFRIGPKGKPGPDLSVHATIFAIQLMVLAQDLVRCNWPGPLGRRELAIV